jgi:hypothetical protein
MMSDVERILKESREICEQHGYGIQATDVLGFEEGFGVVLSVPENLWNSPELESLVSILEKIKGVHRVMADLTPRY